VDKMSQFWCAFHRTRDDISALVGPNKTKGDTMRLDATAKVQIHVGGAYGNKVKTIVRFVNTYNNDSLIDDVIKRRLVIENDDRLFNLMDCISINKHTGIPIVFDSFHHELFCNGEPLRVALCEALLTWNKDTDGSPMVDYSSSNNTVDRKDSKSRKGKHAETINAILFKKFIEQTEGLDFDIMLEIKDKEKSALKGLKELRVWKLICDCWWRFSFFILILIVSFSLIRERLRLG
jgi:UV DNA damage endonuclease